MGAKAPLHYPSNNICTARRRRWASNSNIPKRIKIMAQQKKTYKSLNSTNPVFTEHKWGNSANSGVNYTRPYNKTRSSAAQYARGNS